MQLALVLVPDPRARRPARALALLQRLSAGSAPDAVELRPLARLLTGRLLERPRLEDDRTGLAQQLREASGASSVLNDRLEAMRAIERSLSRAAPRRPARCHERRRAAPAMLRPEARGTEGRP